MKKLIRYQLADGNDVVMEVDDPQSDNTTLASSLGEVIDNVGQKLDDVLGKIKPFTSAVLATLHDQAADEATVEFGVKLAANSGIIFTSAGVEASLIFKLTWKRKPESPTI